MKVWIEKTANEKPDKDAWYIVLGCGNKSDIDIIYYAVDFGSCCLDGYFTHYLQPINDAKILQGR